MRFVFDFDSTLFATSRLWDAWVKELRVLGLAQERINETGAELSKYGFSPRRHAEALGVAGDGLERLVRDFELSMNQFSPALVYNDVIPLLTSLRSEHQRMVLTFGDPDFQWQKLRASGIADQVDEVLVATPHCLKHAHLKTLLSDGPADLVFIDDNPKELFAVHEHGLPVRLVRMRRDGESYAQLKHPYDDDVWQCIQSLHELGELLGTSK